MEFGVFDHLDRNGGPLADYYEERLKIQKPTTAPASTPITSPSITSTPLGMAPSPSVFLSAIAQRTKRLRFGPLVYALPLHHPLRLIEEICMLDQMSGGRLEIGFGRGSCRIETRLLRRRIRRSAQEIYAEASRADPAGPSPHKTLELARRMRFHFENVPMEIEPLQKPHPPLWYGVHSPDSAERAARRKACNMVSLDPPARDARSRSSATATVWREAHARDAPLPKIGLGRFIVVAPTATPRRWRSRAAPIRSGTRASRTCSGMHGRSQIASAPARASTSWSSTARASPARPRR